jgi:hypothetical protein
MATKPKIQWMLAAMEAAGLMEARKGAPRSVAPIAADAPDHVREARRDAMRTLINLWHALLDDITDAELEQALYSLLRDPQDCQWYPQPGKLRGHVHRVAELAVDDADAAWGEACAWLRRSENAMLVLYPRQGQPLTLPWPNEGSARDRAILRGLEAVGGPKTILNLGDQRLTSDNEMAARAAFRAAYRSVIERARRGLALVPPSRQLADQAPAAQLLDGLAAHMTRSTR